MKTPSNREVINETAPGPLPAGDDQIDDILSIVEDLRRQLKNSKEMNNKLAEELRGTQARTAEAEAKERAMAHNLDRTTRLLAAAQSENETLVSEAVAGQEDLHESAGEIQRLRQELHLEQERIRAMTADLEKMRRLGVDVADKAVSREEPLRRRVQELEQDLEERAARLEEQGRELRRAGVALSDMEKEKDGLQAEVDALERYRKAISKIHGALREGPDTL